MPVKAKIITGYDGQDGKARVVTGSTGLEPTFAKKLSASVSGLPTGYQVFDRSTRVTLKRGETSARLPDGKYIKGPKEGFKAAQQAYAASKGKRLVGNLGGGGFGTEFVDAGPKETSVSRAPTVARQAVARQAVAKPAPPPENPAPLAGLRSRSAVGLDTSGAASAISQAAAAARGSTSVGGPSVTASIRNREGISTDVGPQYQLEQLQVNQDLQGRAAAQSTAAHGIRADLPGRVAAQRLTEGRGQTRGRASTILTSGGARGLGSTPANTLGARRLVSGRAPATPVEGTQAGEAAAAQAGVQQRQGIRAEQDRAGLAAQVQADGAGPEVLRNAGRRQGGVEGGASAQRTRRREALIGGTGGEISGGAGGGFGPPDARRGGQLLGLDAAALRRGEGAAAGFETPNRSDFGGSGDFFEAIRRRNASANRDVNAARAASRSGAASRSRQGGRPPQRGNVPERVRARRTLLGGG